MWLGALFHAFADVFSVFWMCCKPCRIAFEMVPVVACVAIVDCLCWKRVLELGLGRVFGYIGFESMRMFC